MLAEMLADHVQIRAIVATLRRSLDESRMPVDGRFASARWALTRRLLQHFAVERGLIDDHARHRGDAGGNRHADNFEATYRNHLAEWPAARIDREWRGYSEMFGDLLDMLERQMAYEERDIYPPLLRAEAAQAAMRVGA